MGDRARIGTFELWDRMEAQCSPVSFDLEVTARCNLDCRHCYINLPAGDTSVKAAEMSAAEIVAIAKEAAGMGVLYCLVTGGEPLLRPDFADIYLALKRLGLLVSVFTNACLVSDAHVDLFRRYPPRDIEVTVYGATRETYEAVTRRAGSYDAFRRGLDRLLDGGIRVRLKAAAMRTTYHELDGIAEFCRQRTKDYYRFDPLLRLRFDGDVRRNEGILAERLTPAEIVAAELADDERLQALRTDCDPGKLVDRPAGAHPSGRLFRCKAGVDSFAVGYDATFRLCTPLWHPDTTYDLRGGSLHDAWERWVPRVRELHTDDSRHLSTCAACPLLSLCLMCPAHAALETGAMDAFVPYFCEVAHARADAVARDGVRRDGTPA